MTVLHVTDATFEAQVLTSELPVLIDLYADWCQPCKMIAPLVEKLATEYAGKLVVAKVNVDENPGLAQALRAQSIPMLVVVAGGRVAAEQVARSTRRRCASSSNPSCRAPATSSRPRSSRRC